MRILVFFGDRLGVSRGTPSRARNMALALATKPGTEVMAVSRDANLDLPGGCHRSLESTTLAQAAAEFRPDVVHGHTHKALPHLCGLDGGLRVVDLHGDPVAEKLEETWRPLSRRLRSAARLWWIDRRHLHRLDGCTTVSRLLARRMEDRGLPARVIWGGVDPSLFTPSRGTPGRELVIGYAGNFLPYQGLHVLLDATTSLINSGRELRLILIGDPGQSTLADDAVRMLGDRVQLTGPMPYDQVPRMLADANVLVIPRPDSGTARAGFPSKLPEYMALGKALVVSDVGDQAIVVRDGVNGLVVPPDNAMALATALDRLRQQTLRESLADGSRTTAERDLSWAATTDGMIDFFRNLLDQR